MMRHITIQEISSRFPNFHSYLSQLDENHYNNIFFIDSRTEGTLSPIIYLMWRGQLGVIHNCRGALSVHTVSDAGLIAEALTVARNAVSEKHPYLASALNSLEIICGVKSSNALF